MKGLKSVSKGHQLQSVQSQQSNLSIPAKLAPLPKGIRRVSKTPVKPDVIPSMKVANSAPLRDQAECAKEASSSEESEEVSCLDELPLVTLAHSIFANRPSTIVFDYPPQCNKQSRKNERCYQDSHCRGYFKLCRRAHAYNCILNAFKQAGFERTYAKNYNIFIGGLPKRSRAAKLQKPQKYNHFPGAWHLGRKDNLHRNVARLKRAQGKDFHIVPKTYVLPEDRKRFKLENQGDQKTLWIFKPAAASCGKGIKLITSGSKPPKKAGVISKYINNPHTLNGRKYDLRLYVCVTSFDPLKIYLYKEGLVRLATKAFTSKKKTMGVRCMHLTNYSVNKKDPNYVPNHFENEELSSKWSLLTLRKAYERLGIDMDEVLNSIKDVIIKTCVAVENDVANTTYKVCKDRSGCFELYGFDILIDNKLKPWLLEVNVSPSLSSSSPFDKLVKTSLMCDVFTLVGLQPRKKPDKKIAKRPISRLILRNGANVLHSETLTTAQLREEDMDMLMGAAEEASRLGHFERIFPLKENVEYYRRFFETERYNNLLLWKSLQEPELFVPFFNDQFLNSTL